MGLDWTASCPLVPPSPSPPRPKSEVHPLAPALPGRALLPPSAAGLAWPQGPRRGGVGVALPPQGLGGRRRAKVFSALLASWLGPQTELAEAG